MGDMVSLNISQKMVEAAIREEVNAGIVRALGDPSQLIAQAVNHMTDLYVRQNGEPCDKNNYNAIPYFQYLATTLIRDCVRTEMEKYVKEHSDEFRECIIKALGNKRFKQATAENFIQSILSNTTSEYRTPINISFEKIKEE